LVEAAPRKDVREDAWERLVGGVNQASRRARLPYYVDPTETVLQGARRWFRIDAFQISSVARFRADNRDIDVLGVSAIAPARGLGQPLGLSHDGADEVLVFTDSITAYVRELETLLGRTPARCSRTASADAATEAASLGCGRVLSEDDIRSRLPATLCAGVSRHELQHQIDRGDPPLAKTLARRARARGLAVPPRINRELSAYLAELTAADGVPRVSLARLLRLAVIDRSRIDGEAARVALQALSGHAADDSATPARCYLELTSLDDAALRSLAQTAWQREFGRALPPLRVE
jgi:hypothetical protein